MSVSFDKKLAELDAYLQMLISENESLDKKLADYARSSQATINSYDREVEGIANIKSNLDKLIGSIKHAIVLLQIAKVSSRSSCSISLDGSSSGSAIDLRSPSSSTNTTVPPTRPIRSSKLTSSSSSSKASSKSATAKAADVSCAEVCSRSDTGCSGSASGRETNESNLLQQEPQRQQQQQRQSPQQDQRPADGATAHAVSPAELQLDHAVSHHQAPTSPRWTPPQLHGPAATLEVAEATTSRRGAATNAGDPACSSNNNNNNNEARRLSHSEPESTISFHRGNTEQDDDDDDAFFDADDEQHNQSKPYNSPRSLDTPGRTAPTPSRSTEAEITNIDRPSSALRLSNIMSETNNNVNSTIGDGSIDWDAMYEEEAEEELGSVESQGSVIKHLLSQIRIGMDLTKVVLPTFILERRSLLEMYADFFAHPDLFSAIPDFPNPEERMVQLVRWYLSAFHAGRKSSLAKKPYNPILGEIFRCNWELLSDTKNGPSQSASTHSTSSNDKKDHDKQQQQQQKEQDLTFVAEQVSHHPPVSAFYAENKEKSISCCAHIYTKSKYLGLSVGVHNIGQGVINLKEHNETYTCTFPSAYGRSILTVPWVELGGPVTITCEQTGYKANIEFLMKPFYGGKKHRVTGEILRPNNEPILTIDGEWNGIMYSKSPPNSSEKKVFVDTTNLPVIKKHVKPVSAQESFESRNVWKEVTRALKMKDVNSATAAKTYIEQRQRDLLKDRQEQGVKWKTRYFVSASEGWLYSLDD